MTEANADANPAWTEENNRPREASTRFRFKAKSEPSRTDHDRSRSSKRHHDHHRSSHHRSKRRRVSPSNDRSAYEDSIHHLPPEVAFRESLFDALGDDEGAAFWQGVYGQPIHNYPNTYHDEQTGELERMNDDEYAQFVRRKMWEKSWEGIEAAKEERRRQREHEKRKINEPDKNKHRPTPKPNDGFVFDLEVEQSLRRGEQRRERKRWKGLWEDYIQRWNDLQSLVRDRKDSTTEPEQLFLRNKIAWPVESGKRKDVTADEIERFILKGTQNSEDNSADQDALVQILKPERIRWHPDKIQQRFGFMEIDEGTMKGVTAVFQVFDRMWNERRGKE